MRERVVGLLAGNHGVFDGRGALYKGRLACVVLSFQVRIMAATAKTILA
jgi:hypothetical protein